eukprot:1325364-Amphidinium_carterae.1
MECTRHMRTTDDHTEWDLDPIVSLFDAPDLEIGTTQRFTFGVWVRQQWQNLCQTWLDLGLEARNIPEAQRGLK